MILVKKDLLIIWIFQLIILILSFLSGLVLIDLYLTVFLLIFNYFLSFLIVNKNKLNIFNAPTFFLVGFGFLILGRFFGWFLDNSIGSFREIFCLDFFLSYCLDDPSAIKLITFLNLSLVFFSLGFLLNIKNNTNEYEIRVLSKSFKPILLIMYPIGFYLVYVVFQYISLALSSGYMALYASQADSYEAPIDRILNAVFLGYLAVLYVFEKKNNLRLSFILLLSIFLLSYYLKILTGARSFFIAAMVFMVWFIFKDKRINVVRYSVYFICGFFLLSLLDYIAQISGAREINESKSFLASVSYLFYSQGITLMVINNSLEFKEYPSLLGYLKTIFPGVQIIYNIFGVTDRYLFDWSSYIIYKKDKYLYDQGYGLGWSIFSDLYYIAYKFIPIYLFLVGLWGYFLNYVTQYKSQYVRGLLFVVLFFVFSISRDNISPLIFAIMMYSIIFFMFTKRIKK